MKGFLDFDNGEYVVDRKHPGIRIRHRLAATCNQHAIKLTAQSPIGCSGEARYDRQVSASRERTFKGSSGQALVHGADCWRVPDVLAVQFLCLEGEESI